MQSSEAPILSMLALACRCCCTCMPPPYFIENSSALAYQIATDKVLCTVTFLRKSSLCRLTAATSPPAHHPPTLVLRATRQHWSWQGPCLLLLLHQMLAVLLASFAGRAFSCPRPINGALKAQCLAGQTMGYTCRHLWAITRQLVHGIAHRPRLRQSSQVTPMRMNAATSNGTRCGPYWTSDGVYLCIFCDLCDSRHINPQKAALTGRGLQQKFYLPRLVLLLSNLESLKSPGHVLQ